MRCAGWKVPPTRPRAGLDAPLEALARALIELGEAQGGVEHALEALDFDPGELERLEERLFAIRALARKHGVAARRSGRFCQRAARAAGRRLTAEAAGLARLSKAVAEAEAAYQAEAQRVTRGCGAWPPDGWMPRWRQNWPR
jgi:DNA repair protein RecN (Recombination protein N)